MAGSDAAAFEIVFERHASAAFSLAFRMCGQRSMAEDAVQEAFLSLWRTGGRYDHNRGSVRTWTLGIVRNRAIDLLRRAGVHESRRAGDDRLADGLEAPGSTDGEVQRHGDAHEIREALARLAAEQLRVIELAYFGGFTHTEIASMLDLPVGTVKGRMRLGLEKLRGHLVGHEEFR